MGEKLSAEEIESRYAPDWVLIGDIETREDLSLVSGQVLFHSPDRDEVYRKLDEFEPGRYAVRCLAPWPEDTVFVL